MGSRRVQKKQNTYVAEKRKMDEYEKLVEDTEDKIHQLKLHGKQQILFIKDIYLEHQNSVCSGIIQKKFSMDVLNLKKKKEH